MYSVPISITLFVIITFFISPFAISSNDQVICQEWKRENRMSQNRDPKHCSEEHNECVIQIRVLSNDEMTVKAVCANEKDECTEEKQMTKNCGVDKRERRMVVCCCKDTDCNSITNLTSIAEAIDKNHEHVLDGKFADFMHEWNQSWTGTVIPLSTTTPIAISMENASTAINEDFTTINIMNSSIIQETSSTQNISSNSQETTIITSSGVMQETESFNSTEHATSMPQSATTLSNEFKCFNDDNASIINITAQSCPQNSCFITVHWSKENNVKVVYAHCDTKNIKQWIEKNPNHDETSIPGFNCVYNIDVSHIFIMHAMKEVLAPNYTMVKTAALCSCETSLCNSDSGEKLQVLMNKAVNRQEIDVKKRLQPGNMTEDDGNKNSSQQLQVNATAKTSKATGKYKQYGIQLLLIDLLLATMVLLSADGFQHFSH